MIEQPIERPLEQSIDGIQTNLANTLPNWDKYKQRFQTIFENVKIATATDVKEGTLDSLNTLLEELSGIVDEQQKDEVVDDWFESYDGWMERLDYGRQQERI